MRRKGEQEEPLFRQFFRDRFDHLVQVEGLFEHTPGAEEFCHIEEVTVPLRAGHRNNLGIEVFSR